MNKKIIFGTIKLNVKKEENAQPETSGNYAFYQKYYKIYYKIKTQFLQELAAFIIK